MAAVAPETGVVLRKAREHGQGWYAAVARAAEAWDTIPQNKKPPKLPSAVAFMPPEEPPPQGKKKGQQDHAKHKKQGREKEQELDRVFTESSRRKGSTEELSELEKVRREEEASKAKLEEEQRELERQKIEFEARAEERRLKAEEERRKAEQERRKTEELKKQRQQKLKGAFAFDGDDGEEDEQRNAALAAKVTKRKRMPSSLAAEVPLGIATPVISAPVRAAAAAASTALALPGRPGPAKPAAHHQEEDEMGQKLRFEPSLSPAEAFMRLQERKRKGRRAEFGGPPRGCSPWRDGKRGVTFEREEEEKRQAELAGAAYALG